jgi:hypothetical protein
LNVLNILSISFEKNGRLKEVGEYPQSRLAALALPLYAIRADNSSRLKNS